MLVTNFTGRTLEILDLQRSPWVFAFSSGESHDAWVAGDDAPAFSGESWTGERRRCCPAPLAAGGEVPGI